MAAALVFLSAVLVSEWIVFVTARNVVKETFDKELLTVARLAASRIDASAHARLQDPSQLNGPEYQAVVAPLRSMLQVVGHLKYIYTVRQSPEGVRFAVDAADPVDADGDGVIDQAGLGELYEDVDPAMHTALEQGVDTVTASPYSDKWGTFVTAFVPVRHGNGRLECVLGVDVNAHDYFARIAQMSRATTLGVGVAALASCCIGLGVYFIQQAKHRSLAALAESERKLRSLYDLSPLGIVLTDVQGRFVQVNQATETILGYTAKELRASTFHEVIPAATESAEPRPFETLWRTGSYGPYQVDCLRKDGTPVAVQVNGVLVGAEDGKRYAWSIIEDVTQQRRTEAALRDYSDRLTKIAENVPGMIYQYRLRPDGTSHFPYASMGVEQIYGLKPDDVLDDASRVFDVLHPDDLEEVCASIAVSAAELSPWHCEYRVQHADGKTIWVEGKSLPQREPDGSVLWHGHVSDITQRKAMESEMLTAARLDRLTSLPNRDLFVERLRRAIHRHQRSRDHHYAVLFLDFDRFKIVNDSLGHEAGDLLLIEAADRLRRSVRLLDSVCQLAEGNTAARFGGDEFLILLEGIAQPADAHFVAERLLEALAEPYALGTYRVVSSVSIGIVTDDGGYERAEDILRDADTAMYEAKQAGKSRFVVFDAAMRDGVRRRMELEHELRVALDEHQLLLHYQPIVSLETGRIAGVEALVRWQHPLRGMVSPGEFIPLAEECGLIVPLGEWVLREACFQLGRWWRTVGRDKIPSVSINLSRQQLLVPELVERLGDTVAEAGITPDAVHLEITEGSVMRDADTARRVLGALKSHGFKLDMDDFGTGHSSLACLHQFPLDVLKIDRSFVLNLSRSRDYTPFVRAIMTLAKSLGIEVLAEGVETAEQLATLQALDCRFAQGYFFARPMPPHLLPYFVPEGLFEHSPLAIPVES